MGTFFRSVDFVGVIARLDRKSGLPDFGIKWSKSETSDFDAIQYPGRWLLDRPVKPGDDSVVGVMLASIPGHYFGKANERPARAPQGQADERRAGAGISGARLVWTDCERRRRRLALLRAAALCVGRRRGAGAQSGGARPFPC